MLALTLKLLTLWSTAQYSLHCYAWTSADTVIPCSSQECKFKMWWAETPHNVWHDTFILVLFGMIAFDHFDVYINSLIQCN